MHEALVKLHIFQTELNDAVTKDDVTFSTITTGFRMSINEHKYNPMTISQYTSAMRGIYRKANVIGVTANGTVKESEGKAQVSYVLTLVNRGTGAVSLIQNCTLGCVKSDGQGWTFNKLVAHSLFDNGVFSLAATLGTRVKFAVDVAKVPLPDKPEEFKATYISHVYLHPDEPEAKKRMEKPKELMYSRWDWATTNIDKLVNCLRLCGHTDPNIQAMCDGFRPLSFRGENLHTQFLDDLQALKEDLEKEMGWHHVGFVQSGSSVPGFSTNPLKGIANQASKVTDPDSSDVDVVIVGVGVKNWVETLKTKGAAGHQFPSTGARQSSGTIDDEMRFGFKHDEDLPKALAAFRARWCHKFGGGMQNTFALSPTPSLPPWETRVL